MEIHWLAFPLHPETPEEGQTLEELFAGRPINIPEIMARLLAVAEKEGLPFSPERTHTYNSRLAQELGKWAEEMGSGEEFHQAMFRAYFVDNLNIAQEEVLVVAAEQVGLPGGEAREVLRERAYALVVEEDWRYAREQQIMAVPTFVAGGRTVVGAQSYETLAQLIRTAAQEEKGAGEERLI